MNACTCASGGIPPAGDQGQQNQQLVQFSMFSADLWLLVNDDWVTPSENCACLSTRQLHPVPKQLEPNQTKPEIGNRKSKVRCCSQQIHGSTALTAMISLRIYPSSLSVEPHERWFKRLSRCRSIFCPRPRSLQAATVLLFLRLDSAILCVR